MKKLPFLLCFLFSCASLPKSHYQTTPLGKVIDQYELLTDQQEKAKTSWPELHSDSMALVQKNYTDLKRQLAAIPIQKLSPEERINHDLLTLIIDDRVFHQAFESHLFPLDAEGGFLAGIVYTLRSTRLRDDESADLYLTKLKALPAYLFRRIELMKEGQRKSKSSPKLVVENAIQFVDELLKTPVSATYFLAPVKENKDWTAKANPIIEEEIYPAYQKLRNFLSEEYLPKAPEAVGISSITDGKQFYEQRVRFYTTFDISPKEVFDIGIAEVKRIKTEMEAIITELGFKGSFADFLKFLREDPQFYAKTGKELLYQAAWITKRMEGKLPEYFGKLPRMPLTVAPVPASLAPNYTVGRYSPGSYERNRAGEYWVNTTKLESRPLYALPALSLHEGVPGHHLQIMLAAEIENMPKFRKRTYLSAYGEGWGLYSEFLGKEAGIYETPYEEFGRLTYEMWRACRLVVDPGMHYMGWTRQEAVDFMAANTALSFHEVNTEINRYIGWPGQAVSYKMGELKIRELRKKAEAALGEQFNIRVFHDKVLENGSIPLETLERVVDGYIKKELENLKKQ